MQESVRLILREVSFYDKNHLRLFIILSKGKKDKDKEIHLDKQVLFGGKAWKKA